jgi:hypothetical protein
MTGEESSDTTISPDYDIPLDEDTIKILRDNFGTTTSTATVTREDDIAAYHR